MLGVLHFPDAIEFHEIWFDGDVREVGGEQFTGAQQFFSMVFGLGSAIALEVREASIRGAIGMAHDEHAPGLVQADRHADLFENELLLEIITRRGEGFGAAGHDDHVGALNGLLLQEFSDGSADPVVEAAEHRSVGDIGFGR